MQINKTYTIYAVIVAIALYILTTFTIYLFRDRTEELRQERYTQSEIQMKTAQREIEQATERKNKAEKCMKANSMTGVLADCDKLHIIPQVKAEETNTGTVTATIKAEPSVSYRDKILMDRICSVNINNRKSPLCNDWELYNKGKDIFEKKGISWSIAIGIMYSESHIGANYAGTCDTSYHNWGGIKWRITDDGKAIKDQPIPQNGCWLYKFNSVEDYFNSKANTLSKYKSCFSKEKPIECISYAYVGNRYVAERGWIERVAKIAY